jgi:hypothetical protein
MVSRETSDWDGSSFYAGMFHVKHGAGRSGKRDSAKQPHALKNRLFFNDMTLRT